jgi:methyl coenzyme M reductase beta subunit
MNLFFRPSYIQQPSNRPPAIADATVVTTLIAAKAAVQAQIDSAMVDLKAACVLAARQELEGGGGALAAPMIDGVSW